MPGDTTVSPDRRSDDMRGAFANELRFIAEREYAAAGTIVRAR
jgi:hypothetical protein